MDSNRSENVRRASCINVISIDNTRALRYENVAGAGTITHDSEAIRVIFDEIRTHETRSGRI